MKKKILLVLSLVTVLVMLSGCMGPSVMSLLNFMDLKPTTGTVGEAVQNQTESDTVTISRAEYEQLKQFETMLYMMDVIEQAGYYGADREKMIQKANAGLLDGVDDVYTFYYSPEEFAKMWEDDKGEYAGVGLQIQASYVTGLCTITRVFTGSPALDAGVQKNDILYKVGDDLFVTATNLQDAVDIMRGIPGTTVNVTFLRDGKEIEFELTRANITVNNVESVMLKDENIGVIRLYEFSGECQDEFKVALDNLIVEGAKGLIIDLRDNPGGWVDAANSIANLFCDKGDTCYLVYKDGQEEHVYRTTDGKTEIPMVILINENSASASEILAGCLRDRADATLVGVNSFGKGIVQQVLYVNEEGAGMQFTIAEYRTPNGIAIHKVGLAPDVEIQLPEGDKGMYDTGDLQDPQLLKALEVIKEKIK